MRSVLIRWVASVLLWASSGPLRAAEPSFPLLERTLGLLREHLPAASPEWLDGMAVEGLGHRLAPRVQILAREDGSGTAGDSEGLMAECRMLNGSIAHLRVADVAPGLSGVFSNRWGRLAATNRIEGVVLDLRFAGGTAYAEAAAVCDMLVAKETFMMDWGTGSSSSVAEAVPWRMPTVILVNRRSRGAAEAMAAVLRRADVGLVIGSRTAGEASAYREFPLDETRRLRVAVSPLKLAGGASLDGRGLEPDIVVNVAPEVELAYVLSGASPVREPAASSVASTNAVSSRLNEAELVRRHRESTQGRPAVQVESAGTRPAGDGRIVDPALGRAVDLLKGLALLQSAELR